MDGGRRPTFLVLPIYLLFEHTPLRQRGTSGVARASAAQAAQEGSGNAGFGAGKRGEAPMAGRPEAQDPANTALGVPAIGESLLDAGRRY